MPWVLVRWVFSFKVEPSTSSLCCMLVLIMVFTFCFQSSMKLPCSPRGLSHWGLQCHNLMEFTLGRHMCLLMMICSPCQEGTKWLLLPLFLVGEASCYSCSCSPATPSKCWGIQVWQLDGGSPNSSVFPTLWVGVLSRLCCTQWHGCLQVCGRCKPGD